MSITTNGHIRDLVDYFALPESERSNFEYAQPELDEDGMPTDYSARFFEYRGYWYDAHDFVRIESEINPPGMRAPFSHTVPQGHELARWVGIATDSMGTGVVIRWGLDWDETENYETIVAGYYVAGEN